MRNLYIHQKQEKSMPIHQTAQNDNTSFSILTFYYFSCFNRRLTEQKDYLQEVMYFFLLAKEVARAAFAGGLAIGVMAELPKMVWRGYSVFFAIFCVMFSYSICDTIFNIAMQIAVRSMNACGYGIPVAVFSTKRPLPHKVAKAASVTKPTVVWEKDLLKEDKKDKCMRRRK